MTRLPRLGAALACSGALLACSADPPPVDRTSEEFVSAKAYALRVAPSVPDPGVRDLDSADSRDYCRNLAELLVAERDYDQRTSERACFDALEQYREDYAKNPGRYG